MRRTIKVVQYRRKREGKTDYRLRLKLVKSNKPRLVLRRSKQHLITQFVEYQPDGDKVLATTTSIELRKFGWKTNARNLPAAYLTGLLCGVKAKKANISEAILDLGLNKSTTGGMLYAVLKGVIDAGLNIPHNGKILPSEARISGEHIANYAKELSKDKEKYNRQFSKYIKSNIKPEDLKKEFEATKIKILKGKQ